jgi:rare lipoprotein A
MANNSLIKRGVLSTLVIFTILAPTIASAQSGIASVYSEGPTATGERVVASAMTAAHRTLPFGTMVRVTNTGNGKTVVVRINDRGPFVQKGGHFTRDIDLSQGAARRIGLPGVGEVSVDVIGKADLYIPKHGDWGVF